MNIIFRYYQENHSFFKVQKYKDPKYYYLNHQTPINYLKYYNPLQVVYY